MNAQFLTKLLELRHPALMIEYLRKTNKLDPELAVLIDTPQDIDHHPEGSAYRHTLMVLDEAAVITQREQLNAHDNAVLRLAAITHDFGKATHTQIQPDGRITAWGHPEAGIIPAHEFMQRSNVNPKIIDEVLPLVELHMAWVGFYTPDVTSKAVKKLLRKLEPSNIYMLSLIVEADMSGRGGKYYKQGLPQRMKDIITVANSLAQGYQNAYPDHLVSGDDIMQTIGIEPSPLLGKIKSALYKAQQEGRFTTREEGILFLLHHVVIVEDS